MNLSDNIIDKVIDDLHTHYGKRFADAQKGEAEPIEPNGTCRFITSDAIKPGNYPRIFHHGEATEDLIILTHGLSDSPYYMEAVAKKFFHAGVNVILPLLPAHGLKDPDKALQDFELDTKWREEINEIVRIASQLGSRISLGGFSTGGALSYYKILNDPDVIKGGMFLFSGAIDVKLIKGASRFSFLQSITKITDGVIQGNGRDPYKYPQFPNFGALELGQIIRENRSLSDGIKIPHPVFAAHSVHDKSAKLKGIIQLLEDSVHKGLAYIISENVTHSELPLNADIPLNEEETEGPQEPPRANPRFEDMMATCLRFFDTEVRGE